MGNVPSMRNPIPVAELLDSAYRNERVFKPQLPHDVVPRLLPMVRPVHTAVKVDIFVPGCPPHADTIFYVIAELLEDRMPDLRAITRFGA